MVVQDMDYLTLLTLLCLIHRDGGHYVDEHGLSAGLNEAIRMVIADKQAMAQHNVPGVDNSDH